MIYFIKMVCRTRPLFRLLHFLNPNSHHSATCTILTLLEVWVNSSSVTWCVPARWKFVNPKAAVTKHEILTSTSDTESSVDSLSWRSGWIKRNSFTQSQASSNLECACKLYDPSIVVTNDSTLQNRKTFKTQFRSLFLVRKTLPWDKFKILAKTL